MAADDPTPSRIEELPAAELAPTPESDQAGVDLTLLRETLAMSPAERLRAGEDAAWNLLWIERAARSKA